jgi:hypothetical protein
MLQAKSYLIDLSNVVKGSSIKPMTNIAYSVKCGKLLCNEINRI